MKVIVTKNYEESCKKAASEIKSVIQNNPTAKLGLATGGTVEPIYPHIIAANENGEVDFSKVHTVNLDEYVGMDGSNPQSYRYYMNHHLFDHININKANTYVASGVNDPEAELAVFKEKIHGDGGVDLQLLGVGMSGHIGFNEPAQALTASAHIEQLEESTIAANARYFDSLDEVPRAAFTMGMGDILKAKRIILIVTGESKANAMRELLMHDMVTSKCPVTMLKLHRDVTVVIDEALASAIGYQ